MSKIKLKLTKEELRILFTAAGSYISLKRDAGILGMIEENEKIVKLYAILKKIAPLIE